MNRENILKCHKKILKIVGLAIVPAILYFIPYDWVYEKDDTICMFKNLTGLECPGCGMTRALISIIHFDFVIAYGYNKLVVVVAPLLLFLWLKMVCCVYRSEN